MGDTERNEEEMESLMSNERDRTLTGIYLIYCHIALSITEFNISGLYPWMWTWSNFSDKSSVKIFSRFCCCCISYKLQVLIIIISINNQNTTTSTINEMNQRISISIKTT